MRHLLTPAQKAANALRKAEQALQNWQDDPNSPRKDVDKMLHHIADLRTWVQAYVIADLEHPPPPLRIAEVVETYAPAPRDEDSEYKDKEDDR